MMSRKLRLSNVGSRFHQAATRIAYVAICAVATSSAAADPAAKAPIPIINFVRHVQVENPRLSPDGQYLVVNRVIQKDGRDVTVMVIYHLADMKITSTVQLPVFEVPGAYRWITNTRLAVRTARESGTLEAPSFTGEVMAMDVDGGRQEYLYGYKQGVRKNRILAGDEGWSTINSVSRDLDGHLLLTEHPVERSEEMTVLYDVDSVGAARHQVAVIDKKNFEFLVSSTGKPLFAFGGDKDDGFLSTFRYDEANRRWVPLPGTNQRDLLPMALGQDEGSFIATVSNDNGRRELVRQTTAGAVEPTVLFTDPVGSVEPELIEWDAQGRIPFAAATNVDVPSPRFADESIPEAKLYKLLAAQFPGEHLHFIDFARDGSKLIFTVRSDRNPGDYFLFDRATSKATLLFSSMPWIDPAQMAERRPIQFKSRDGLDIHGYLTMPKVATGAKPPLILLPHGGPIGTADDWFYDPDAQFLANRGYAVLQVNFRGSSGRGGAFAKAGRLQYGDKIQDDLVDGVRAIVRQGAVDEERMCVFGASFGAYSAMMINVREPGMFKCAVGYSGLYDIASWETRDEVARDSDFKSVIAKIINQDPGDMARISPTKHAGEIKVPVLLIHGSADLRTPPQQAKMMREALVKAGNPPEWMYVEDEGHGFYAEKSRQAFYEKLESFLAKNLAK